MAKDRLPQIHTIHITTASRILAQLRARKAVKRELQKQGLKPAHYSAREITSWSMLYLEDHAAELMPAAIEQARAMILRGDLGKRAQRALAQAQCSQSYKIPNTSQTRMTPTQGEISDE